MTEPAGAVLCVDVGSTFTKALLVDLDDAVVVGIAQAPTFGTDDVMDAVDACRAELAAADPRAADADVLACSSAGGGLRILVVGYEELVTAEAGRRVALSSGGRVAGVVATAGRAVADTAPEVSRLGAGAPRTSTTGGGADLVLLTGGTDGGNRDALVGAARAMVASGWRGPVVVAGNVEAYDEVGAILAEVPHVLAANAVPRIGVLAPEEARAAIREQFLRHVIGGKGLSQRPEFTGLVRGATPDVVLSGVEVLARVVGDVAVVDVGGSTTDVYSVVTLDPERSDEGLAHEVVAPAAATRTVEADLGMRESTGIDRSFVPATEAELDRDETIARAAAEEAVRRHAGRSQVRVTPEGRVVERSGVDLREVALVVGSGGVLRHGRDGVAERVLGGLVAAHHPDGWQLPERARVVVDADYTLLALGLLAPAYPDVADALARRLT
ncbi:glutamate mutase L [Nocardioides panacisoli]|uniref:Methylaspartate mutase accessory protein GlmL n=1 Tax=Nocardioides panacisoli TaxID=627624 RepID=A0ABP7HW45_9ACTN